MLYSDLCMPVYRILAHIVLGVFFFAIWLGPGRRRLTWLLWTIAFVIDTAQLTLGLLPSITDPPLTLTWTNFALSLLWLWVIIAAAYTWNNGERMPRWLYGIGTFWMVIMMVIYATGYEASAPFMLFYMAGVLLILGHIYAKVGGILLGLVGIWAGGGDALVGVAASVFSIDLSRAMAVALDMSVELASLILFLTILYLYLSRICVERADYEALLYEQNTMQKQALNIVADLEQMENKVAQEELDDSTVRFNGELTGAGEYIG